MKRVRILALILVFACIFGLVLPVLAVDLSQAAVYSLVCSPSTAVINGEITYTVVTDTNATKVAILNADKTIHQLADIGNGFAHYSDEGEFRTWTIKKVSQLIINEPKFALASTASGNWSYIPVQSDEYLIVKLDPRDDPTEPWTPPNAVDEPEMGIVAGSFIQPWLFLYWDQARWEQEFAAMKELDMRYLIIQNSTSLEYETGDSAPDYGEDYTKYPIKSSSYVIYPSEQPELKSYFNIGTDQLKLCLEAAKKYDMQVIIGLDHDTRWWKFGWNDTPTLKKGGTDAVTDSYFYNFCTEKGDLSARMIKEIWANYGKEYGEQIFGWYYPQEIWNFVPACKGTDNAANAKIIGTMINYYIDAIEETASEKPLSLSPFMNFTISTAEEYGDFWRDILAAANLRSHDIFMPQDSIGNNPDRIGSELAVWTQELYSVSQDEGLKFWSNNETFTSNYTPAEVSRVIQQIEITDEFAERHVVFSWNHYYNPIYNSSFASYNDAFKAYISSK